MDDPAILFVKPGAVKDIDKRRLSQAGVIVVEVEDPSSIKLVRAGYELPATALMAAAAKAIKESSATYGLSADTAFGRAVSAAMIAAYTAAKAGPNG